MIWSHGSDHITNIDLLVSMIYVTIMWIRVLLKAACLKNELTYMYGMGEVENF